ncbi:MAG: hypothetical protein IPK08_00530 [Bacteroidetes bacterium]|nr:hypothetical protein [Bacteroidota bacterium]
MATGPLQIVLNSNDFIDDWFRPPGGGHKDFYADHDKEFIAHKKKISDQVESLRSSVTENKYSDVSYVKVILKPSAIAKSHWPTHTLFNNDIAPIIGSGDLGELIAEVLPNSLTKINEKIYLAEEETRYKVDKKGKRNQTPLPLEVN